MAVNRSSPFFSGQLYEGWTVLSLAPGVYSFFRQDVQDGAEHQYLLPLPVHVFRSFSATIRDAAGELGTAADFACDLYREIAGSDQWSLLSCSVYEHERDFTRLFTEGSLAMSAGRYTARVTGKVDEILYLEFVADFRDDAVGGGNLHTLQDGREGGLYAIGQHVFNCSTRLDDLIGLAYQDVWQAMSHADNAVVTVTRYAEEGKHHYLLGYVVSYSDDRAAFCELQDGGYTIALLRADMDYHSCVPGLIVMENSDLAISLAASGDPGVSGYVLMVGVTR
ncbi:hypothetical protein ES708_20231 [subsurface metagenome]